MIRDGESGDESLRSRFESFVDGQSALVLAVDDPDGAPPVIGTLPFLRHGEAFFVLASELAPHTAAMRRAGVASVALMADQADTRNPFARERAQWQVTVGEIERGTATFETVTAGLRERHGQTVDLLCGLADFHLFALEPGEGRYVNGFGRAYRLSGFSIGIQLRG
ncbi:MAG: hypothetical protein ACLFMY_04000 [Guyparkeria sp.]|uniref:hypothetical protein n=1 Tax=Guyparkeria sp. TaxID=2035736 RepID=UPI0039783C96